MKLFIRIKNGQPFEHPILGDNFRQAFPEIDTDNLPPEFARFERILQPNPGVYEVYEGVTYEWFEGIVKDVHHIRPLTEEEKTAKQQATINAFNSREQAENWSAWTLDEETCTMVPPIPRPTSDQAKLDRHIFTFWCGADNNWKDTPPYPQDDKRYKFDFFAWLWIETISE